MRKAKQADEYYQNMPMLQLNEDGSITETEYQPERKITLADRLSNVGNKITDALLGKQAAPTVNNNMELANAVANFQNQIKDRGYSQEILNGIGQGLNSGIKEIADWQSANNIPMPTTKEEIELAKLGKFNNLDPLKSTISATPRSGGLLNDIARGYNENYNNRFTPTNIGQNKGWGMRIGEGLGTLGRFLDSPLGRGIIAGGLNSALGYGNSLQEGLTAAVGRQNAQTADRVYRQQLAAQGIDTSDIKGNINSDIYRQILYGQQLKENAEYRQMYLDNQQRQNEIMNQLRKDQLARQERQDNIQNQLAFGRLGVEQARLAAYIQSLKNKENKTTEDKAALRQLNDNTATLADIDAGLQLIEENPQAYTWLKGKIGSDLANRLDPKGVPARTQIDNITAVYRKWLTGAQMSDAERKAYERFLPAPTDNAKIVKAKLNGMKQSIERKNQALMQGVNMGNSQDVNPLGLDL